MKAVVLVAGKGTRMAKYYEGPKQLLPVGDKPVIEHSLDLLPPEVDGLVFVVGGPHEQTIRDYFKSGEHDGRPIEFVRQEEQLGLAHAFRCARELVTGRWLGMVGDDIFGPKGMQELVRHDLAALADRVEHPEKFGVLVADDEGYLVRSVEKPQEFISNLVWTGAMVMDESFLDLEVPPSARGEYETPDVWMKMIQENGAKIKVVETDFWLPINDKEQLEEAERVLSQ
ncbi:MAG: nucleotidyltransferase family protein [Candidatus Andersenbacteria bacterium]|nr:nucleotidyltransferase family protein [bacterium]MDZ4225711.1 nucleotidyltransferase family protein [Candidatus Andersenbacteria bacterium]